jgi:anti-sigma factor RsiW
MNHLTPEDLERYADGEIGPQPHLRDCPRCAAEALSIVQMKRAIRDAMSEERPSSELRRRVRRQMMHSHAMLWWAVAAVVALAFVTVVIVRTRSSSALPELVDMHATLLASANPVDVLSSDRHTVKPWFEGRLPFTVPVPDLAATPFRLIGGRVVYWRGNPAAYLLIGKAAHRISVFIFRDDIAPRDLAAAPSSVTTSVWHSSGLTFVAVAQVPQEDVAALQRHFFAAMPRAH